MNKMLNDNFSIRTQSSPGNISTIVLDICLNMCKSMKRFLDTKNWTMKDINCFLTKGLRERFSA